MIQPIRKLAACCILNHPSRIVQAAVFSAIMCRVRDSLQLFPAKTELNTTVGQPVIGAGKSAFDQVTEGFEFTSDWLRNNIFEVVC